jgi:phage-related protein (TIGR01555 family)
MWLIDSLVNLISGLGTAKDKSTYSRYAFTALDQEQLEAAYRSDWIARKIVDIPAQDATRAWRSWTAPEADIEKLEEVEKAFGLQQKVKIALIKARLYGGSALLLGVDQGMPDEELVIDKLGVDCLKFVHVLSRYELTAGPCEQDILSPYYGEPQYYERNQIGVITSGTDKLASRRIHPSRVVRFLGADLPGESALHGDNQGWGDSVLQAVNDAVRSCGMVVGGIAALVDEAKIDIIKIPDFTKKITTKEYTEKMTARWAFANTAKSTVNALLIDKEEEWDRITVQFAGMPDVIKGYLMIAAAAADIPATRMLSQAPQGLNSTGDSDTRNHYDRISTEQQTVIGPRLNRLDEVVIRSAIGKRDPNIWSQWNSLWQMTEVEKTDLAKKKADLIKLDNDMGLIPFTALAKVRETMLIDDGTYPGIEEALKLAEEAGDIAEPPPDPMDLLLAKQQQQIGGPQNVGQNRLPPPGGGGGLNAKPTGTGRALVKRDWQLFADMEPRTLYVRRDLLNKEEFFNWAKSQGFKDLVDDPHVTILYSKSPVDWMKIGSDWAGGNDKGELIVAPGGPRLVEPLGNEGAVVLSFANSTLSWRHEEMVRSGGSHDYDTYQPHVTISYDDGTDGDVDLSKVEPYRGKLVFGPEVFQEIRPFADANPYHEPAGSSIGGQFASREGGVPGEQIADEHGMMATTPEHFIAMRNKSTRPGFLSPLKPDDLLEHTLIINKDGTVGAAISKDGDIQNVFNNGGPKGGAADAMKSALARGGKTLDCYDGFLPQYYKRFGMTETERLKFDPQYAPKNWDYAKHDNPDVVFMKLRRGLERVRKAA